MGMGKLIYSMNVSLDGFVETPDHSLDWADVDEEVHTWFNEQSRKASASIYGRRMYEVMTAYWPTGGSDPNATPAMREYAGIWAEQQKVVFSRTLDSVGFGCRLVKGDIDVSGPDIAGQFIERGLVDEYILVVHPVAIGGGTPFFPRLASPISLRQTATKRFASGVLALTYEAA
jgi:dihydrofolate reductase